MQLEVSWLSRVDSPFIDGADRVVLQKLPSSKVPFAHKRAACVFAGRSRQRRHHGPANAWRAARRSGAKAEGIFRLSKRTMPDDPKPDQSVVTTGISRVTKSRKPTSTAEKQRSETMVESAVRPATKLKAI